MRPFVILVTAVALLGTAAAPASAAQQTHSGATQARTDQGISAAKRKERTRGHQAYGSGQQIACTQLGCNPIPRGCRIQTGRIPFTWDPSGFDEVVCPYRR